MTGLRLLALGVGDAFSARYYSSCLALEAEGTWLLIDCPHPIRKIVREAGQTADMSLDIDRFGAVALTHLHADHCSGLEGLAFYNRFVLNRPATDLLAHPVVASRVWTNHLAAGMEEAWLIAEGPPEIRHLEDFFQVTPLSETREVLWGPFSLLCRRTLHTVPTTAFRIRAAGRCVGISADTAYDPGLIDWLSAADLVIHETNLGFAHTPYEKLAALPATLRRKMRLIHYTDTFNLETSAIEPLRQGTCLSV
jgi:ribonuclease BN (tRNA processing enzyme)